MDDRPDWLTLGEAMLGPILQDTSISLQGFSGPDFHVTQIPTLALNHLDHSLQTAIEANKEGRHAVALSLLRQAVEALTIVELGLVAPALSYPLLEKWDSGKRPHGELRRALEQHAWPKYGSGLWNEPWSRFFAGLAKAVQPYAHCSPQLLQWNLSVLTNGSTGRFVAGAGLYDPVKASRLTLFHILVGWTLGRIVFANRPPPAPLVASDDVRILGVALSKADLLVKGEDWALQFWPHMFFKR